MGWGHTNESGGWSEWRSHLKQLLPILLPASLLDDAIVHLQAAGVEVNGGEAHLACVAEEQQRGSLRCTGCGLDSCHYARVLTKHALLWFWLNVSVRQQAASDTAEGTRERVMRLMRWHGGVHMLNTLSRARLPVPAPIISLKP